MCQDLVTLYNNVVLGLGILSHDHIVSLWYSVFTHSHISLFICLYSLLRSFVDSCICLYRSSNLWKSGTHNVFGGQTIGQSLVAASKTVTPHLHVHSMHCYFLLKGNVIFAPVIIWFYFASAIVIFRSCRLSFNAAVSAVWAAGVSCQLQQCCGSNSIKVRSCSFPSDICQL